MGYFDPFYHERVSVRNEIPHTHPFANAHDKQNISKSAFRIKITGIIMSILLQESSNVFVCLFIGIQRLRFRHIRSAVSQQALGTVNAKRNCFHMVECI